MDNVAKIVELATEAFRAEYGDDSISEEGTRFNVEIIDGARFGVVVDDLVPDDIITVHYLVRGAGDDLSLAPVQTVVTSDAMVADWSKGTGASEPARRVMLKRWYDEGMVGIVFVNESGAKHYVSTPQTARVAAHELETSRLRQAGGVAVVPCSSTLDDIARDFHGHHEAEVLLEREITTVGGATFYCDARPLRRRGSPHYDVRGLCLNQALCELEREGIRATGHGSYGDPADYDNHTDINKTIVLSFDTANAELVMKTISRSLDKGFGPDFVEQPDALAGMDPAARAALFDEPTTRGDFDLDDDDAGEAVSAS